MFFIRWQLNFWPLGLQRRLSGRKHDRKIPSAHLRHGADPINTKLHLSKAYETVTTGLSGKILPHVDKFTSISKRYKTKSRTVPKTVSPAF